RHRASIGNWPSVSSGRVIGTAEEWLKINVALDLGLRGLPGGSSLAKLLQRHRGRRNHAAPPRLTEAQILRWCDAHHRRTGEWPKQKSGPIAGTDGESWLAVSAAMRRGTRGLPRRRSLARLLADERDARNRFSQPALSLGRILLWARAYYRRHGEWPTTTS